MQGNRHIIACSKSNNGRAMQPKYHHQVHPELLQCQVHRANPAIVNRCDSTCSIASTRPTVRLCSNTTRQCFTKPSCFRTTFPATSNATSWTCRIQYSVCPHKDLPRKCRRSATNSTTADTTATTTTTITRSWSPKSSSSSTVTIASGLELGPQNALAINIFLVVRFSARTSCALINTD